MYAVQNIAISGAPNREQDREDDAGGEVAPPEGDRRHVAGGGSECERGQDRAPVEELPWLGVDAVDRQGPLVRPPPPDEHAEGDREHGRRHDVGDADPDVQDVGRHRPEHADHDDREPVLPRDVGARAHLDHERHREPEESERYGDQRSDGVGEEVRRGLAHPGGQDLDDPEEDRDLRDLAPRVPSHDDRDRCRVVVGDRVRHVAAFSQHRSYFPSWSARADGPAVRFSAL